MRPAQLVLARAEQRLAERLEQLEAKLASASEASAAWIEYAQLAAALAAIAPLTVPGAGRAMSTEEIASAFNLSPMTARRKGLKGELPVGAIRLGPGPRAKLRWAAR
jgi:hypothetical protein